MLCSAAAEAAATLVGVNVRAGNLDDEPVRAATQHTLAVGKAVETLRKEF